MTLLNFRPVAGLAGFVAAGLLGSLAVPRAAAQQSYHNVVNQHFRTVSDGPQSALIVDVPDAGDTAAVHKAALAEYNAQWKVRSPVLQRQVAFLRQTHKIKPGTNLGLVDVAIVRQNGRLMLPASNPTRAAAGPSNSNDVTFDFPTSGTGAWDATTAGQLNTLANTILKPLVRQIVGPPLWNPSTHITVYDLDPRSGKTDSVVGALVIVNGGTITVDFPNFTTAQDQFLQMAQIVAQIFQGPLRIGYDAWEQGMARAVTVAVAQTYDQQNPAGYLGTVVDPATNFFYTSEYDIDNQPPLANNTFSPPTKSNQPINLTSLAGMLVPRLRMSSTAWLKCYIESASFFKNFNAGLYAAFNANGNVLNDVTQLRAIAKAALPGGQVEGQDFDLWFEQQYVLDTAVTPGPKLYADTTPTYPTSTTSADGGVSVVLVYYQTTLTGDESDLDGVVNPIYWNYNFTSTLNLDFASNPIPITGGLGFVAPFLTNLGGAGGTGFTSDQMRVAMDFGVNKEYVRVYVPANQTGVAETPNDFSGVIVGSDGGPGATLAVTFGDVTNVTVPVMQGEFGGQRTAASVGQHLGFFSQDLLKYSSAQGAAPITFKRNVYHRRASADPSLPGEAAPTFELIAPAPTVTLTSPVISAGPQMISLPLKPLATDLTTALGLNPKTALLAQYRADLASPPALDRYLRYPSLPLYQPGYGLWSDIPTNFQATVTGENTDVQGAISVPLQYGWNQIGSPYSAGIVQASSTGGALQFSYLGSALADFPTAVQNGWVQAGIFDYDSVTNSYADITQSGDPTGNPINTLVAWRGYWLRVTVTEGLTITYVNSNPASRAAKSLKTTRTVVATPVRDPGAWRVPLTLSDGNGGKAVAALGQSSRGSDSFVPALDSANPPLLSRAASLGVQFPHPDWDTGAGGGGFLSDIRRLGTKSQWNVSVALPRGQQSYTLAWGNTASLPHGTRLTLTDNTTGTRRIMNGTASYTFSVAKGETTRSFQIVAEPKSAAQLFIQNLFVEQPLRTSSRAASSVTIHYELSAEADTTVEIQLNGRTVRHLGGTTRAAGAGANQLVWDLKDDQNRALPNGAYLLNVNAQTPEGARSRMILPFLIVR